MTHEEAALFVPDLGMGRLAPEEEAAVRAHVAECTECNGLAATYQAIGAALRAGSAHPDPAELVAHVMGDPSRREVVEHLASCASCAGQAAAIRAAESELGTRKISMWAWGAWAAAAAFPLILGYFGWIHLKVLPGMRDAVALARAAGAASPETVALPLLAPAMRGAGEPVVVAVGPGQRSIAVAVSPALPRDLADAELLTIEVREQGGAGLYSRAMTAAEMRRLSGTSGAFALVLPASVLPTGDAWLYIRAASGGELLAAPFRVRRD
jgi:anti-sigma factor RsiW